MRLNRILLPTVLVALAMVAQVSVLARLHLPGAVPDLLLLTVLGLAISYGHVAGCVIGFFAGLLADLAPPADHAVGRYALVLCVIGYVAGLFKPENGRLRTAAGPMLVVIGAAIGTTVLYAGVGSLVGDTAGAHVGLAKLVFTATLYDLLLAPFVVPLVMAMARRFDHDPMSEGASGGYWGGRSRMRTGIAPQRAGLFGRAGKVVRVSSMARGARR
jgi:rod shape-determining protein MreD